jgi:hypothetical protein
VCGEPVPDTIDHRDGDQLNNRIANLRAASVADNRANSRMPRNSQRQVKGVYFADGGYQAAITRHGKQYWLGRFATLEEASAARQAAAERLHGSFSRHR